MYNPANSDTAVKDTDASEGDTISEYTTTTNVKYTDFFNLSNDQNDQGSLIRIGFETTDSSTTKVVGGYIGLAPSTNGESSYVDMLYKSERI
jgi:hypothetical protein